MDPVSSSLYHKVHTGQWYKINPLVLIVWHNTQSAIKQVYDLTIIQPCKGPKQDILPITIIQDCITALCPPVVPAFLHLYQARI